MSKLRIEKPSKSRMPAWMLPSAVIFLLVLAGWFFFYPSRGLPVFEVENAGGDVQVFLPAKNQWIKPSRGTLVGQNSRIKTGPLGEIDLHVADVIKLRIKENSELVYDQGAFYEKNPPIRLHLEVGSLLAATQKAFQSRKLVFSTPEMIGETAGGKFTVEYDAADKVSMMGALEGVAAVKSTGSLASPRLLSNLQSTVVKQGSAPEEPKRVTREEWMRLREIYELTKLSAAMEAMQLDLSKQAGTLFDFVFDHGTFYTPKVGYCGREFFVNPSDDITILEVEYDVFPTGSYTGMYIKTRELDLSQFETLEFEMRHIPDKGYPKSIRVEIKTKSGIIRGFAAKLPKREWTKESFPLNIKDPALATEVTLVFANDRVGEFKKGTVQIRNVNLVPKEPGSRSAA